MKTSGVAERNSAVNGSEERSIRELKNSPEQLRYRKMYSCGYRALVPALGATRRLQALRAIGYTLDDLIALTGLSRFCIQVLCSKTHSRHPKSVTREVDAKVREVFRMYCVQPRHNNPGAERARTHAKKVGWAPPMAWDDIDNKSERPKR